MQKKNTNGLLYNRRFLIILSVVLVTILIVLIGVSTVLSNKSSITFSFDENEVVKTEYGQDFEDDAFALYFDSLFSKKGENCKITSEGTVDTGKLGKYEIKYTASYGNYKSTKTRTVEVVDTTKPVIELVSNPENYTNPNSPYREEGYKATDNYDGDITSKVIREEKDGVVTYKVSDSSGNETVVVRTIVYRDAVAPIISLSGSNTMQVELNSTFTEPGYSAADDCDGDVTKNVKVEGTVDTSKLGVYTLTYSVTDSAGNTASAVRSVYVYQKNSSGTVNPGDKVVYLTFDDGPGRYTQKLLDVLDKYNVKVTFFVTNQFPAYQYLIAEEYKRGHTVAIHTYSHDYAMYSDEKSFFDDIQLMSDVIYNQTGHRTNIMRFPGGSSNGISRQYCQGIMTRLVSSVTAVGYKYCDWNVSSGDATSDPNVTKVTIFENVKNGISQNNVSCVLQHDIKEYSVDAVEDIIVWGLSNGYTFLPLTEDSPMFHHAKLNN